MVVTHVGLTSLPTRGCSILYHFSAIRRRFAYHCIDRRRVFLDITIQTGRMRGIKHPRGHGTEGYSASKVHALCVFQIHHAVRMISEQITLHWPHGEASWEATHHGTMCGSRCPPRAGAPLRSTRIAYCATLAGRRSNPPAGGSSSQDTGHRGHEEACVASLTRGGGGGRRSSISPVERAK